MSTNAKTWLREAGHGDIADKIAKLEARWRKAGKATRRDWWQVLAGSSKGTPTTVGGITFPILRAARDRQGLDPVRGALGCRKGAPAPPPVRVGGRWPASQ